MPVITEEFNAVRITNASVQFKENGVSQLGKKFGAIGSIEGETELLQFIKKAEGVEVRTTNKPQKMTMTVSAHIPVQVARDLFGLSNKDLVPGVYTYGTQSKGKEFIFTADVIDDLEDKTKLIAFTNCVSATGFKFTIENGADELAELEIEFTAMKDSIGGIYYEAIVEELGLVDTELGFFLEEWHTNFTPALVTA